MCFYERVSLHACMYLQWLTVCVYSVSLSLHATKKSSAFVLKCSNTQAFCSRPSKDKLQWASVPVWICSLLYMNSANRENSFIHWLIATLFKKNLQVDFFFLVLQHYCIPSLSIHCEPVVMRWLSHLISFCNLMGYMICNISIYSHSALK